ncbi:MAG: pyridoxamine 5'-phosphate oxidase family protein [Methanomicrobiales archaeon]
MMKNYDEPMCPDESSSKICEVEEINLKEVIRELLESESFAVLSTQGQGQPYASLISFYSTPDLKNIVFATSKDTRKFSLISKSNPVALLVDDRSKTPPSVNKISAATVTGKAQVIEDVKERRKWADLLVEKHPYLDSFVKAPSTAVILIHIYRYFYVRRFQEVFEWNPHQK